MPPRRGGKSGKISPEAYERKKARGRERYAVHGRPDREPKPSDVPVSAERGTRKPRPGERPACGTCTGSGCMDTLAYDCPDCGGTGLLTGAQALAHYELKHALTIRAKGWLTT